MMIAIYWVPAIVFSGWLINYIGIDLVWGPRPPSQLSDSTVRRLAVLNLGVVMAVYSVSAYILLLPRSTTVQVWVFVAALVVFMLLLECAYRWWGSAASMGGDFYDRLPRSLGLGARQFGLFPLYCFCIAFALNAGWRYYRSR